MKPFTIDLETKGEEENPFGSGLRKDKVELELLTEMMFMRLGGEEFQFEIRKGKPRGSYDEEKLGKVYRTVEGIYNKLQENRSDYERDLMGEGVISGVRDFDKILRALEAIKEQGEKYVKVKEEKEERFDYPRMKEWDLKKKKEEFVYVKDSEDWDYQVEVRSKKGGLIELKGGVYYKDNKVPSATSSMILRKEHVKEGLKYLEACLEYLLGMQRGWDYFEKWKLRTDKV